MNVFVLNVFEDNCSYSENYVCKSVRDAGVIWYEHEDTNQMPLPAKHSQLHPVKNPTKKHTNNRFLKSIIKSMKLLPKVGHRKVNYFQKWCDITQYLNCLCLFVSYFNQLV